MESWQESPEPAPDANDLPLAGLLEELLASSEPGSPVEELAAPLDFTASGAAPWAEPAPAPPEVEAPAVLRTLDAAGSAGAEAEPGDLSSLLMARLLDESAPPVQSWQPPVPETGPLELPAALAGEKPDSAGPDLGLAEPAVPAFPEPASPSEQGTPGEVPEPVPAVNVAVAGAGVPADLAEPVPLGPSGGEEAAGAADGPGVEAASQALVPESFEGGTAANVAEPPRLHSGAEASFLEARPTPDAEEAPLGQETAGPELCPPDAWLPSPVVLAPDATASVQDGVAMQAEGEEEEPAKQVGEAEARVVQVPEAAEAPAGWTEVRLEQHIDASEPRAEAPEEAEAQAEAKPAPSRPVAAGAEAASGRPDLPDRGGTPLAGPADGQGDSGEADEFELVDAEQAERFLNRLLDAARTFMQSAAPAARAAARHAGPEPDPGDPSPAGSTARRPAGPPQRAGGWPEGPPSMQQVPGRPGQPPALPRQADQAEAEGSPIPPAAALMALGLPERLRTRLESIGDLDRLLESRSTLAPAAAQGPRLLVFRAGETYCGLPLEKVREVERAGRVTAVPGAPAFIKGLVNVRGEILPLVDLSLLLGTGPGDGAPGRPIVAPASPGEPAVALLVEEFHGLAPIQPDGVRKAPQDGRFLGSLEHRGRQVWWLDPAAVFGSEALERAAQSAPGAAG